MEKRLAESQEQILSATKDLQTLKEENKKLSKSSYAYQPVSLFYMLSISAQNLTVQSTLKKITLMFNDALIVKFWENRIIKKCRLKSDADMLFHLFSFFLKFVCCFRSNRSLVTEQF